VADRRAGARVVAVASAMGDGTDELLALASRVCREPAGRDLDLLLATAEQVSTALLALAVADQGEPAVALTGAQAGIRTNSIHGNARILTVDPRRVVEELDHGRVVVVTGFQGATAEGEITTLGRGGSDTSATALAAALGADRCEIFTDVEGVFSADPRVVSEARLLERISAEELQELAWHGAQVMKAEAVELARDSGVPLTIRSSFSGGAGTTVIAQTPDDAGPSAWPAIAGVSGRTDLLRIALPEHLPPAVRSEVFAELAGYDLVSGRLGDGGGGVLYLSTLEMSAPQSFVERLVQRLGPRSASAGWGAVALVGFGIGSRPTALLDAVDRLTATGTSVRDTFTSRESLCLVVEAGRVADAVRLLHRELVAPLSWGELPRRGAGAA
jgi:aspartate kinase